MAIEMKVVNSFQEKFYYNGFPFKDLDQVVEIDMAFKIFDRDGSGYIDEKEFKSVVTQMGNALTNAEADEFIQEADLNGDGKLDYDEFMQMMLQSI